MAAVQRKLVHKQFNSPMGLYSPQNVKETLERELKAFGADGIEIDEQIAKPLNLANSAVLRAVEEEDEMKCGSPASRRSRARHRPQAAHHLLHSPLHQQQLEQLKTQFLTQQHDVIVDRDTVLRINRLATRRNLHKRDRSWPPQDEAGASCSSRSRSSSNDNAVHFDVSVCQRHVIEPLRERFSCQTYVVEATPKEVRQQRMARGQPAVAATHKSSITAPRKECPATSCETETNAAHESDYRSCSSSMLTTRTAGVGGKSDGEPQTTANRGAIENDEQRLDAVDDEAGDAPPQHVRWFSAPETKAADENIGLVEPRLQYYEQLCQGSAGSDLQRWHSTANVAATTTAGCDKVAAIKSSRQSYSLERGRAQQWRQHLPPLKPRAGGGGGVAALKNHSSPTTSPLLQRCSMKPAADVKIASNTDAANRAASTAASATVDSAKNAGDMATATTPAAAMTNQTNCTRNTGGNDTTNNNKKNNSSAHDLEHIPLPATPTAVHMPLATTTADSQKKLSADAKVATDEGQQQRHPQQRFIHRGDSSVASSKKCQPFAKEQPKTVTFTVEPRDDQKQPTTVKAQQIGASNSSGKNSPDLATLRAQEIYDDACIYLRSIDLADNTLAYVPAAITIVPSPTEEMWQRWGARARLSGNIADTRAATTAAATHEGAPAKAASKFGPDAADKGEHVADARELQQEPKPTESEPSTAKTVDASGAEERTYITRLPATSQGIQLTCQTSTTKRKSAPTTPTTPATPATPTNPPPTTTSTEVAAASTESKNDVVGAAAELGAHTRHRSTTHDKDRRRGVYYTDGEYLFGPFERDVFNDGSDVVAASQHEIPAKPLHKQHPLNRGAADHSRRTATAPPGLRYDELQQSISAHLRQIDAYMTTAKLALNRSMQQIEQRQESQPLLPHTEQDLMHLFAPSPTPSVVVETPLQVIVKQIVRKTPQQQQQQDNQAARTTTETAATSSCIENMPVVERALLDLASIQMAAVCCSGEGGTAEGAAETWPSNRGQQLLHVRKPGTASSVVLSDGEQHAETAREERRAMQTAAAGVVAAEHKPKTAQEPQASSIASDTHSNKAEQAATANYEKFSISGELKAAAGRRHLTRLDVAAARKGVHACDSCEKSTATTYNIVSTSSIACEDQQQQQQRADEQVIDMQARNQQQSFAAHGASNRASLQQQQPQTIVISTANRHRCENRQQRVSDTSLIGYATASSSVARPLCVTVDGSQSNSNKATWNNFPPAGERLHEDETRQKEQQQSCPNESVDTYQATCEIRNPYVLRQVSWEPASVEEDSNKQKSAVILANSAGERAAERRDKAAANNELQSRSERKEAAVPHRKSSVTGCTTATITTPMIATPAPPPPPPPPPPPQLPTPYIRRYPTPLIEPSGPTARAASPFGLNAVEAAQLKRTLEQRRSRTHSSSSSTPGSAPATPAGSRTASPSYVSSVPQVEGHNVGLLVRTAIQSRPEQQSHANKYAAATAAAAVDADAAAVVPDDELIACVSSSVVRSSNIAAARVCNAIVMPAGDERQHVRQEKCSPSPRSMEYYASPRRTSTMQLQQPAQQQQQQQHQCESYSHLDAVGTINRSFDNISPRPYGVLEGYKRVAWPPVSEERLVREFTPQPQSQFPPQQQQMAATAAAPVSGIVSPAPHQGPIYNNVQPVVSQTLPHPNQHQHQQHQQHQQPANQPQVQQQQYPQMHYQQQQQQVSTHHYQQEQQQQQQTHLQHEQQQQQPLQYTQAQYRKQATPEFSAPLVSGSEYFNQQQSQQQHQQQSQQQHQQQQQQQKQYQPHVHFNDTNVAYHEYDQRACTSSVVPTEWKPVHPPQPSYRSNSYDHAPVQQAGLQLQQQPQQQQQQQQQRQHQYQEVQHQAPPSSPYQQQQQQQLPSWAQQQQQPQSPYQAQPNQYPSQQQQQQQQQPPQYQFQSQPNQCNSYSQPQQQQLQQQDYRDGSPGIITLRKEAPVSQKPAPVFTSQPATVNYQGGNNMRGDLKWPPPEYKEQAAKENEERRMLAQGPVCRPRKVKRDYTQFFAKNQLNSYYPSYKVPPGTQHMTA